jgi:hypothetical protein
MMKYFTVIFGLIQFLPKVIIGMYEINQIYLDCEPRGVCPFGAQFVIIPRIKGTCTYSISENEMSLLCVEVK